MPPLEPHNLRFQLSTVSFLRSIISHPYFLPVLTASLYFIIGVWYVCTFGLTGSDESSYYVDTQRIADCLRNGLWIGNEPVGTHGFLFKLVHALLFIVFDSYIPIPTIVNLALASASLLLCYALFSKYIADHIFCLLLALATVTNVMVLFISYTYLIDINALFVMLVILLYMHQRRVRIIPLAVLLAILLDAKEYVFFITFPMLMLFLFLKMIVDPPYTGIRALMRHVVKWICSIFVVATPALCYIYLCLHTSIIPYNASLEEIVQLRTGNLSPRAALMMERSTGVKLFKEMPK